MIFSRRITRTNRGELGAVASGCRALPPWCLYLGPFVIRPFCNKSRVGAFDNHCSSQGLRFRRLPGGRGALLTWCIAWPQRPADASCSGRTTGSTHVVRVLVPPEQRWDDPWLCTRLSTLSGCFSLEHYAVMVLWRNVVDNAIELRAGNPGEHPETS